MAGQNVYFSNASNNNILGGPDSPLIHQGPWISGTSLPGEPSNNNIPGGPDSPWIHQGPWLSGTSFPGEPNNNNNPGGPDSPWIHQGPWLSGTSSPWIHHTVPWTSFPGEPSSNNIPGGPDSPWIRQGPWLSGTSSPWIHHTVPGTSFPGEPSNNNIPGGPDSPWIHQGPWLSGTSLPGEPSNNNILGGPDSQLIFPRTEFPATCFSDNTRDVLEGLPLIPGNIESLQNESWEQPSTDSKKGKKKAGGRPKIPIAYEDLLQHSGGTVKAAAEKLDVSESTVDRRIKEFTGMTWSEFQRYTSVSRRENREGRMQEKDWLVKVDYNGIKPAFKLPLTFELEQFQKRVESSLKVQAGHYKILYFDGSDYLDIVCDGSLQGCLHLAREQPPGDSFVLKLVDTD